MDEIKEIKYHQGSLWDFKSLFLDSLGDDSWKEPSPRQILQSDSNYCVFIELDLREDAYNSNFIHRSQITFFNQNTGKYFQLTIGLFEWAKRSSFITLINDNPDGKLFIYKETIKTDKGTSFT